MVVAALEKLLALDPPRLLVDTGDAELDRELSGYRASGRTGQSSSPLEAE